MHPSPISVEEKALDHPAIQGMKLIIAIPWIIPSINSFITTSKNKPQLLHRLDHINRGLFMCICPSQL